MNMNRLYNAKNPYQGKYKRVLAVCSAGLLRSPTAAWVLSNAPFHYNTRSCGIEPGHALILLDDVLLEWADEVVCMDSYMASVIQATGISKPIINLNIGDNYAYRDAELIKRIRANYSRHLAEEK